MDDLLIFFEAAGPGSAQGGLEIAGEIVEDISSNGCGCGRL